VRRRTAGHNLLEVILATFILLLLIVITSGVWVKYAHAITQSRDHLVATHLGRTVLENVVDLGYGSARSDGPFELIMEVEVDGQTARIPFTYTTTVTQKQAGLKRVIVDVSYTIQEKKTEVSFETLLAAQ
jgi:hypothetical protein